MILGYLLLLAFACFLFYCILPTWFYRLFRRPDLNINHASKQIMLTFDDGPDQDYTEKVLKVLAENNIQAVFFLVAQKAAQFPELTVKIQAAGHLIGLHSLAHTSAWCKNISFMKYDFTESLNILSGLGCNVQLYRPPWGLFNLSTLYFMKRFHLKPILWTVMVQDWEKSSTAERVYQRLKSQVKDGAVICLHDSGAGTGGAVGAPEEMIIGLKRVLPELLQCGYHFVLPNGEEAL